MMAARQKPLSRCSQIKGGRFTKKRPPNLVLEVLKTYAPYPIFAPRIREGSQVENAGT